MKKITIFVFTVLCIFTMNAQKNQTLQLEALQKKMSNVPNHTTNINDYFTAEEQALIKEYFYKPSNTLKVANAQSIAFGINNGSREFSSFDTADGVLTGIATSPDNFESAGAVDPNDPFTVYVLDDTGLFFSVNAITGVYTELGTIAGRWWGLEFDPTTGVLYGLALTGVSPDFITELHTIDIVGLTSTLVGATTMLVSPGLAIDGAGNAFAWDLTDDNLYAIDLTNGTSTVVGPIGFDSGFGQGFFWETATDTFYMTSVDVGNGNALELRSVDVTTGLTTVIATTGAQIAWASSSFSEPADNCGDHTSLPAAVIDDTNDPVDVITVPVNAGIINDLNIAIDITHTFLADLNITLTSPAGTTVDLFFDKCTDNNDMNIMFDDEGDVLVCNEPTVGTFIPDNALSAFDGEAFEGDWTLTIVDDAPGDEGVLNTWCLLPSLTFPCGEPSEGIVTNIASTSADLGWTVGPDAESMWDVEWGPVGFLPGTETELGMVSDTPDNPFTAIDLTITTDFEFYVRAACNANDSSDWVGPFAFTTLGLPIVDCADHTSSPAAIIDDANDPVDVITVPADAGNITDLNVIIDITHTWTSDLEITLTSPAGTVVDLFFNKCAARRDINIMFDDEGASLICGSLLFPVIGVFVPDNPLSAFDGEPFEGDWTLTVVDSANDDDGVLNTWCLIADTDATASITDNIIEGFEFYPNPANDVINLKALNTIDNIELFNALGQKVITQTINETTSQLDISRLSTGFYVMKVTSNNQVASYQIIKK
ncbi:MAG: proprotein convertase P-domain-containing protein [Flavobacteriaceae bacterium]|nr:proprotein convertase P-domain-containing protein [Flavobacteriaceae bacterium]